LLARRGAVVVIGLRFMYGLRFAGLIAIGMSRMPWLRFARFNLFGALLWAFIVAGTGYLLGSVVNVLPKDLRVAEHLLFAAVIVVGITVWVVGWRARRGATRSR
jgi:membrane protein DedA with SNARE-associated domain